VKFPAGSEWAKKQALKPTSLAMSRVEQVSREANLEPIVPQQWTSLQVKG